MPRDGRLYMTFPIDFWKHEKVRRLSDAAFRAFVEANGHSRERETDGVIEAEDAEFLWDASALQELCTSHPSRPLMTRGGSEGAQTYVLRSYAEHQFTKADRAAITEKRRAAAEKRWSNASAQHLQSTSKQTDAGKGKGTGKEREEIPTESLSSETAIAPIRPEITRLLDLLDTEIVRNGGKAPKRTKKNIDAVRLMLDRDGYSEAQIERAIRWCQADEFWRANILSASKLREKYEQLRLAAQRSTHSPVAPDDKFHDTVERGRRLAALTNQGEIAS